MAHTLDTRPDPEDAAAEAHFAKVQEQLQKDHSFPVQILRGRKLPSDAKVAPEELDKLDPPPAGWDEWVDVYEGPQGIGYVVNYEVQRAGKPFRKAINQGPETFRDQDWEEVREGETGRPVGERR